MKCIMYLAVALSLFSYHAFGQERGPIAHWDFDDGQGSTLSDSSGNDHHGTIAGATWVQGKRGKALAFDGKDDQVEIKLTDKLNITGDMSLMWWLKTESDNARDRLIYGDGAGLAVRRNISIGLDRGTLFVAHGNGKSSEVITPTDRFANHWQHIAVVFQKPYSYIYIDGELSEVRRTSVPVAATRGHNRYIGGWWAGHFKGAIDDMVLFGRAVSESEILTHYHGRAVQAKPVVILKPRLWLSRKKLLVNVVMRNMTKPPTSIELFSAYGKQPLAQAKLRVQASAAGRSVTNASLDIAAVKPGKYELRCDDEARLKITIPRIPDWVGSDVGKTEKVLAPFTPVKREGNIAKVIGREFELAENGLLNQITAAGKPMLAMPMRFVGAKVTCERTIDYDGLVTMRVRVAAPANKLTLQVPLHASCALYLHVWDNFAITSGNRPKEYASPFRPIIWLGDNQRGLSFFCESDQYWQPADPDRAIEIVQNGDIVELRLNLIGKPITQDATFTFAFHPTPVKPIEKDGWDYRLTTPPDYGHDYDLLTKKIENKDAIQWLKQEGVKNFIATNWTGVMTYPWPIGKQRQFRSLVSRMRAKRIGLIPYLGYQINRAAPEYPAMHDEVVRVPLHSNPDIYPGMDKPQTVDIVCLQSAWQDALVYYVDKMMKQYRIAGVYLDSTNMTLACSNELHGCGYRDADGELQPTYPIFAVRETFKRLYTVVKKHKPDGIVDSHVYDCMNSASLSFATSYWNGEQLSEPKDKTLGLPLDRFRAEMMGFNWGVPADFLHYKLGGYNKACAIALLHDVTVRSYTPHHKKINGRIYRLAADFGRKKATFKPYWTKPIADLPENCYASVYEHPSNGQLVIVSNLGRKAAVVTILGTNIKDGMTRERLSGQHMNLEPMAWRYLWIK